MKLCECEVNDIIRWKEGGSLWRIIIKGTSRWGTRLRVTLENLNGVNRTYDEYTPEYRQDVINLTKLGVNIPIQGTRFEIKW